jgi:murein L,D-transpeptidase YafK
VVRAFVLLVLAMCSSEPTRATVDSRLAEHGDAARARLAPHFASAAVAYPPAALTFVAIKDEARLEVWGAGADGTPRFVRDYPVLAASGGPGPKLREGDLQVPEGAYAIDWLNPNSDYHLSMHIDYPNPFDRAHADADGRTDLGGAIMIHGSDASIGCLAIGDPAIEELFVLVADAGLLARVLIAPTDLRRHAARPPQGAPAWTAELYDLLRAELAAFTR